MLNDEKDTFICPECGSTEASSLLMVSTTFDPRDPWSSVLQRITCAKCDYVIPAHLGERWNNISIEDAQQEWQKEYRETAWKSDTEDVTIKKSSANNRRAAR
jgi:hypothetical protein